MIPQRPPLSLPPCEGPGRRRHLGTRKGTLDNQHTTAPGVLGLDFPVSSTVKNKILLVVSSSVCGILLLQPEWAKAMRGRSLGRKHKKAIPGRERGMCQDVRWAGAELSLRGCVCRRVGGLAKRMGRKQRWCWKRLELDLEVLIWHSNALSCR